MVPVQFQHSPASSICAQKYISEFAISISKGNTIMKLEQVVLRDDRASQPLATDVAVGTLYYVTDENNICERSNGTTWDACSQVGADFGPGMPTSITVVNGIITAIS
jgi:hypothetical protein